MKNLLFMFAVTCFLFSCDTSQEKSGLDSTNFSKDSTLVVDSTVCDTLKCDTNVVVSKDSSKVAH